MLDLLDSNSSSSSSSDDEEEDEMIYRILQANTGQHKKAKVENFYDVVEKFTDEDVSNYNTY